MADGVPGGRGRRRGGLRGLSGRAGRRTKFDTFRHFLRFFGHPHVVIFGFYGSEAVEGLLLVRRFETFREVPSGFGKVGPLEDGERGSEANSGRRGVAFEEDTEGGKGQSAEIAEAVAKLFGVSRGGFVDGGGEGGGVPPEVDGGTMDAGLAGGGGNGGTSGEGRDELSLDRRQRRMARIACSGRGHKRTSFRSLY